jgi:hypothetical protein
VGKCIRARPQGCASLFSEGFTRGNVLLYAHSACRYQLSNIYLVVGRNLQNVNGLLSEIHAFGLWAREFDVRQFITWNRPLIKDDTSLSITFKFAA